MRNEKKRVALFAAGAFAAASVLSGTAVANPAGVTYAVHVRTSFGTVFKDCFSFDTASTLTIAGLGGLTYKATSFGPGKNSFFESAAPQSLVDSVGDSYSFSGYGFSYGDNGTAGYLKGIGISGTNNTFIVNGKPDPTCSLSAKDMGVNNYKPH